MVLIFGKAMHETMQSLVLAALLGSPPRGHPHITSAAGGGRGVSQKLTIADKGGRGGKPNADNC